MLFRSDRIRLHKVTPDVYDWYAAADAFILASDVESLPRSMMEAMAFEAVPIVSAVFGVPELLTDGETGILFQPSSESSVEDALRRYLSLEPSARERLAVRGRELIEKERSSQRYAAEVRQLIDRLVADPSALPLG